MNRQFKLIVSKFVLLHLLFCSTLLFAQTDIAHIDELNKTAKDLYEHRQPKSLSLVKEALALSEKINYERGKAMAIILLGRIETDSGNFSNAEKLLNTAFNISEAQKDFDNEAIALSDIGNLHLRQGNYETAIRNYLNGLTLAHKAYNPKTISVLENNIAIAYMEISKYEDALTHHAVALQIRKELDHKNDIAASFQNIANVYFAQYKDSIAMLYLDSALKIQTSMHDEGGAATTINTMAAIYVDEEKYEEAFNLTLKVLEIRKRIGETIRLPVVYGNLSDIACMKKDFSVAPTYLNEGLAIAFKIHSKKDIRQLYESYSYYFEETKQPDSALKYFKLNAAYRDSILSEKNSRQINELQTKYETSEKESKIALQEKQITYQNRQKIFLFFAIGLIIIIAILLFNRNRIQAQKRLQEEIIKQEQERLRAMIITQEEERKHIAGELHDGLGQMLSAARLNIESIAANGNDQLKPSLINTLSMIDDSCNELRNISHQMMPALLINRGLAPAVQEIADKINKSGKIAVTVDAEDYQVKSTSIIEINLYRIIQEWLNNILKHSNATSISIQLSSSVNEITLMIEDNGHSFDTSLLSKGNGNGWYNINSRLDLMKGEIEIDSKPNLGTVFTVYIPLDKIQTEIPNG